MRQGQKEQVDLFQENGRVVEKCAEAQSQGSCLREMVQLAHRDRIQQDSWFAADGGWIFVPVEISLADG